MDLLYGHNEAVAAWVAAHIPGCERGFDKPVSIGVVEDERLIGGTCFHNYNPEAGVIEMSSAGTSARWLSRPMLKAIFGYVFDQLGCQLVVMRVSERNSRMIKIAEKFGFSGHLIPRLRGRDEAEWIYCLTVEQWRQHPLARSFNG
jgi:RimJ/RimL family protein N-acetyltransferase